MGLKEAGLRESLRSVSTVSAIPDSELSDFWPTDEGSGATVGNANSNRDATISGATWQTGLGYGDAYLLYDGTDDVTNVSDAAFGDADLTHAVWFRPDTSDADPTYVISSGFDTETMSWQVTYSGQGNQEVRIFLNNKASGGDNISLGGVDQFTVTEGQWAFVAFTCDITANEAIFYGALQSESSISQLDSSSDYQDDDGGNANLDEIDFGARDADGVGDHFDGAIDAPQYGIGQVQSQSDINNFFEGTRGLYE